MPTIVEQKKPIIITTNVQSDSQFKQLKQELDVIVAAKKRSNLDGSNKDYVNKQIDSLMQQFGRIGYDVVFTNNEETEFIIEKSTDL